METLDVLPRITVNAIKTKANLLITEFYPSAPCVRAINTETKEEIVDEIERIHT